MVTLIGRVEVDNETFAEIEAAAAFFSMEIRNFVDGALESGLAHACQLAESADEAPGEPDKEEGKADVERPAMSENTSTVEPSRDMMVEFFDLNGLMRGPASDRHYKGQNCTVPVQIDLPAELAMLAAWLELKTRMRWASQSGRCNLAGLAHSPEVADYVMRVAHADLIAAFEDLKMGKHRLLFPRPSRGDDDLPF